MPSDMKTSVHRIVEAAEEASKKLNADVFLFNAQINSENADSVIKSCRKKDRKENVLLVLVTEGGSADAAYRIARCMQKLYTKFYVMVSGWCKSAGTLICIGAHRIYMDEFAELGPLDVQLSKTDELWEYNSGLTVDSALDYLQDTAFHMFETYFMEIKKKSGNRITFKTATDISYRFVSDLLRPVYEKIDPEKVGEVNRSMTIAYAYGHRLNVESQALISDESLQLLVQAYPTHSFVIDRVEANALLSTVTVLTPELIELDNVLGELCKYPTMDSMPAICYLDSGLLVVNGEEDEGEEDDDAPYVGSAANEDSEGRASGEPTGREPSAEVNSRSIDDSTRATTANGSG